MNIKNANTNKINCFNEKLLINDVKYCPVLIKL